MQSPADDATTHARRYELAKARAQQLRQEAVTAFWRSVATAVQRGASASVRTLAARMRPLPQSTHTSPKA